MIPQENNKIQNEILCKKDGWEKLKIAFELNEFARNLIRLNIKSLNPNISESELNKLVVERFKR